MVYVIKSRGEVVATPTDKAYALTLAKAYARTHGAQVWVTDQNGHCTAYYDGRTSGVHIVATAPRA